LVASEQNVTNKNKEASVSIQSCLFPIIKDGDLEIQLSTYAVSKRMHTSSRSDTAIMKLN